MLKELIYLCTKHYVDREWRDCVIHYDCVRFISAQTPSPFEYYINGAVGASESKHSMVAR